MVLCASLLNQFDKKKMSHAPHFQRSFYFLLLSDCRLFHDQMRKLYWVGGGVVCCQTFSFVLFSLFSRPRAGLATVSSSFFRVGNQYAECEKQQLFKQVNNGVVYLDYEDAHHHGPLLCSFQLLYRICLYCLMMYWFVFPFVLVCLPFCIGLSSLLLVSLHGD